MGYFSNFATNKKKTFIVDKQLDGGYYGNIDTGLIAEIISKRSIKITLKKISKKDKYFYFTFRIPYQNKAG